MKNSVFAKFSGKILVVLVLVLIFSSVVKAVCTEEDQRTVDNCISSCNV